jgi:hypothetical protein
MTNPPIEQPTIKKEPTDSALPVHEKKKICVSLPADVEIIDLTDMD